MKKKINIAVSAAIGLLASTSVLAADDWQFGLGATYGVGNSVVGAQAEYNLASVAKMPVSIQGFWKQRSETLSYSTYYASGKVEWKIRHLGAAAIYDVRQSDNLHYYAGLGFSSATVSSTGSGYGFSSPSYGGVYYTGGLKYNLSKAVSAIAGYNNIDGISIGAEVKF